MNISNKLYISQINNWVGDIEENGKKIISEYKKAVANNCDLIIFPEMTICGYPCDDLWQKKYFIKKCQNKVLEIANSTISDKCSIIIGSPTIDHYNKKDIFYNSAVFLSNGEVKKIFNKRNLPNYGVFDERRYFEPAQFLSNIEYNQQTIGVIICEDMWEKKNILLLKEQILDFLIVINSSPYNIDKHQDRLQVAKQIVATINKPLVYVNQIGGQDSLIFDGSSFAIDKDGKVLLQMKSFAEDFAIVDIIKNIDNQNLSENRNQSELIINNYSNNFITDEENQVYSSCILGLRDYVYKNGFKKVILGMSGGIDSAIVATLACDALGPENVELYALPTRFNSDQSIIDATACAKNLNINLNIISIDSLFSSMQEITNEIFKKISNLDEKNVQLAQENIQSRIRGNLLMAISNASNALLISTGNKSELACGYATIYGDMCGAYNPIKDLYKTQIYELAKWRNLNVPSISNLSVKNIIPKNIITKAPSAELRENQKDSDSLPEYDVLDQILYCLIEQEKSISEVVSQGFSSDMVKKIVSLLYNSEYKRKQSVIGPKISSMSFDKDRRYPITNKFKY